MRKWVQEHQHVISQDPPSDEVPTLPEIAAAVSALKNYKAAGVCGISPEMIKYGGPDGLKMLHILIVHVWREGVVPEDWKKALIVPLFKKGDPTNSDNYRGMSLLSLPGKVFAIVLKNRLQKWAAYGGAVWVPKGEMLQRCNFQPQGPVRAFWQDMQ